MLSPARTARALAWACVALIGIGSFAVAQDVRPGVDYRPIVPQSAPADRIEVIDFFFYPCPYCNQLAPYVDRWLEHKPADVVFRRVPVVRHDSWAPLAKIYYTLEALGAERLHLAAYHSYHADGMHLESEDVAATWAGKQGLDVKQFMTIYRSRETLQKVEQAKKMTLDYDIRATPSIVVDGKYLTSSGMTGGVAAVMPTIDRVIAYARLQRAKK